MKKLKLDLIKQSSIRLSADEVNVINGGGVGWSDRRGGKCKYSRENPDFEPWPDQNVIGCLDESGN